MNQKVNQLAEWIRTNFANCTGEELKDAAKMMEIDFHPQIGDDKLRDRLLEKLGRAFNAGQTVEVPASGAKPFDERLPEEFSDDELKELARLNLTPGGTWQGRRYRVSVSRPASMKGQQAHPFRWGGHLVMVPWNVNVDVPFPVYEILRNSRELHIDQERSQDKKGTATIINHKRYENRFQFNDMGITPGTEHLPKTQKEQFRKIAEGSKMFKDFGRSALARMARRLGINYKQGIETEAVREIILRDLGYDLDVMDEAA